MATLVYYSCNKDLHSRVQCVRTRSVRIITRMDRHESSMMAEENPGHTTKMAYELLATAPVVVETIRTCLHSYSKGNLI
jgi:hypothetical protein